MTRRVASNNNSLSTKREQTCARPKNNSPRQCHCLWSEEPAIASCLTDPCYSDKADRDVQDRPRSLDEDPRPISRRIETAFHHWDFGQGASSSSLSMWTRSAPVGNLFIPTVSSMHAGIFLGSMVMYHRRDRTYFRRQSWEATQDFWCR